jgi:Uma2 family endonuclease
MSNFMSPSVNHSYIQANLIGELRKLRQYSVFSELSIEINSKEYVPDVCIYPKRKISLVHDIVRMTEIPLLAVEILSPSQVIQELTDKIEIYLNAGIQSCWLVVPATHTIAVYHNLENFDGYSSDKVIDEKLSISLPLSEIFLF